MLFNSLNFALFLPIVFILYWVLSKRSLLLQNCLVLLASYFFYACWDYRFLFLLIFTTVLDYFSGIKIAESTSIRNKKIWFWFSIIVNLSFLGFFKYYNFFADSFEQALSLIGFKADFWTLKVILPVGISFYTFHGLSYVIDIYNERLKPERNFINYSVFVCFFPLLVAGPIERASHLIPQIIKKRSFDYSKAVDGLRQMLWGLFKKIVIADNCAIYVNDVFDHSNLMGGSSLLIGSILFSIQVYCDFSGYTDIALGTARLFGFELMRNFNFPYLSKSVTEFWRRWHISLSSWFNDYLFSPLTIKWRDGGKKAIYLALIVTFLVAGLWHGAGFNFIIYGFLHGLVLVFELATKKKRKKIFANFPFRLVSSITHISTFLFVTLAFIFFRSESLLVVSNFFNGIFSKSLVDNPINFMNFKFIGLACLIILTFGVEYYQKEYEHGLYLVKGKYSTFTRWSIYLGLVALIIGFGTNQEQFIYFQF
jgi:alginate O-acetyltransferase complex protein AlgI